MGNSKLEHRNHISVKIALPNHFVYNKKVVTLIDSLVLVLLVLVFLVLAYKNKNEKY